MNADKQLDTFRRQWEKELKHKDIPTQNDGNGPVRPSVHNTAWHENKSQNLETESCKNLIKNDLHGAGTSSLYYPFQIAGKLLHSNNGNVFELDKSVENNSTQNINSEIKRQNNKRQKLTKLEDIFVEKTNREIPTERLLDKLISDIVRLLT
jgi:hypothetical protein